MNKIRQIADDGHLITASLADPDRVSSTQTDFPSGGHFEFRGVSMSDTNNRREFLQTAGLTAVGLVATAYPGGGVTLEAAAAPAPARTMGAKFREG